MCVLCERREDAKSGWKHPPLPYHDELNFGQSSLSGNVLENDGREGYIYIQDILMGMESEQFLSLLNIAPNVEEN